MLFSRIMFCDADLEIVGLIVGLPSGFDGNLAEIEVGDEDPVLVWLLSTDVIVCPD